MIVYNHSASSTDELDNVTDTASATTPAIAPAENSASPTSPDNGLVGPPEPLPEPAEQSDDTAPNVIRNSSSASKETKPPFDDETVMLHCNLPVYSPNGIASLYQAIIGKEYPDDDAGNGYLFADTFKQVLRYVPERKQYYYYNGCNWEPSRGVEMELAKGLSESLDKILCGMYSQEDGAKNKTTKELEYRVRLWRERRSRETFIKDATSVDPVYITEFDKNPYLLNCLNGTIDLEHSRFYAHRSADFLTKVADVIFDPSARCLRWEQHIDEVTMGDKELAKYLQKALGYALSGVTNLECLFLLYGPTTRNGKGVTMETFRAILGDYGKATRPETITQKMKAAGGNAASSDIARLHGARFVNISEPKKGMVLDAALVKTLTGRDKITARNLYENEFEFYPQFKMFINTNYLPEVNDQSLFDSGRIKVIPFERHFEPNEQDPHLKDTLRRPENLSGILNWCIQGWQLLMDGNEAPHLEDPPAVVNATLEYRSDSDRIAHFIEENFVEDAKGAISTQTAYAMYKTWCAENGYRPGNQGAFSKALKGYDKIRIERPYINGKQQMCIIGYSLKQGTELEKPTEPRPTYANNTQPDDETS